MQVRRYLDGGGDIDAGRAGYPEGRIRLVGVRKDS